MAGKLQLRLAAVACLGLWGGILCACGQSWQPTTATNSEWEAIASSADGTKLISASVGLYPSHQGLVYTSSDSGQTWVSNNLPTYEWGRVACSADGSVMMAGPRFSSVLPDYVSINSGQDWATITNQPVLSLSNLEYQLTLPVPNGNAFYRLATP